jgi:hypothetical protein
VPVVLSRSEVEALLGHLQPPYRLVGLLLYGCGLRLSPSRTGKTARKPLGVSILQFHPGIVHLQASLYHPTPRWRGGWGGRGTTLHHFTGGRYAAAWAARYGPSLDVYGPV